MAMGDPPDYVTPAGKGLDLTGLMRSVDFSNVIMSPEQNAQRAQQAQQAQIDHAMLQANQANVFHNPVPPPLPSSPERPNQLARDLFFARMGGVRGKFGLKPGDFLTTHVDCNDNVHVFYCFGNNSGVTQEPIDMFPSDTLIAQFRIMLA